MTHAGQAGTDDSQSQGEGSWWDRWVGRVHSGLVYTRDATGLPWWAVVTLTGAAVRVASLPLTAKAMQQAAQIAQARRHAVRHVWHVLGTPGSGDPITQHAVREQQLAVRMAKAYRSRGWWMLAPIVQVRPAAWQASRAGLAARLPRW
jgi:hypothetical protein